MCSTWSCVAHGVAQGVRGYRVGRERVTRAPVVTCEHMTVFHLVLHSVWDAVLMLDAPSISSERRTLKIRKKRKMELSKTIPVPNLTKKTTCIL
jgi:hypothetical protein